MENPFICFTNGNRFDWLPFEISKSSFLFLLNIYDYILCFEKFVHWNYLEENLYKTMDAASFVGFFRPVCWQRQMAW